MKRTGLRSFFILLAITGLTACEKDIELTRTANDPFTIERTIDIPVYRRECHGEHHYGPSPQCGSYQSCHSEWVCHDHKDSVAKGNNDNCHYHQYCQTYYHSCHYTVQVCNDIYTHTSKTNFRLEFDPRAVLSPGDVDTIGANMHGNSAMRKFDLKIKSKRYEYEYPKSFYVDLSKPTTTVKTYVKVVGPK